MAVYKCIGCDTVEEANGRCSCSRCGHWMFEMPYNKKDVLASEIERFFDCLKVTTVQRDDLVFKGKSKDDLRFPSYDKIFKYVSGKRKTEDFQNSLLETIEQLKLHFTSQFSKPYPISFENLDKNIKQYDEVFSAAIQVLRSDMCIDLPPVQWEEASLLYTESPNKYLWFSASELLGMLEQLGQKIVKFIKMNNLYGDSRKYHPPKVKSKFNKKTDFKNELENAISKTEKIQKKKYVVDIIDDGSAELQEMLTCLWNDIELLMCTPLFIQNYEYLLDNRMVSEETLLHRCSTILAQRYVRLDATLNIASLLYEKTEDTLFKIYKKLISLDKFGFLVSPGTVLIDTTESERKLNELIGLTPIKNSIRKIKAYAIANKGSEQLNLHMCFYGNPGTGKTEVARLIAGILYENGILPSKKVVEVDRGGLVGQYVGETPQKTMRKIKEAMGGILFVDEAYALVPREGGFDYGHEAVATLLKAMEDYRGKFCVILAGYRNQMHDMLSTNPGFKSRIQFELDFPNYARKELEQISGLMLKRYGYTMVDDAVSKMLDITDVRRKAPNFANAREIRNILEQVIMCQNVRCVDTENREIGLVDVNRYIMDAHINLPTTGSKQNMIILTADEELEQLIGLASIKRMVKKIKAYAKRNKQDEQFNLHMCFYGNPGTGKTEVARILSRILYDAGVLAEAKLIETDSHGLIGRYVGETAPKTEDKVREAIGGVLFIDEAYGLASNEDSTTKGYGDEAISVLLKKLEDLRGQFCTIFAGYQKEMQAMISANPGLKSRIQFTLEFPDYSREELGQIAEKFLSKKGYTIELDALEKLLDITDHFRELPDFANARTVRTILDQVIMNQNLRTEDEAADCSIILIDVEDYLADEKIDLDRTPHNVRRIGFM